MDKLEIQEVIHEKEERLKNLERMRDKFNAQPNPLAAMRTEGRITEVVEDLHDLRNALAEFEERDGQIRTGSE
jgi:DNA repair ATPase RecN